MKYFITITTIFLLLLTTIFCQASIYKGELNESIINYQNISHGDLVINELVSDPIDGQNEWIELFNKTQKNIDLTGFSLEDGSKKSNNLEGIIKSQGYFILEKPKGALNNSGDAITLKDNSGNVIDQLSYGDWNDGNTEDNAPQANDPNSLARKSDGYDTNIDKDDFMGLSPIKSP